MCRAVCLLTAVLLVALVVAVESLVAAVVGRDAVGGVPLVGAAGELAALTVRGRCRDTVNTVLYCRFDKVPTQLSALFH